MKDVDDNIERIIRTLTGLKARSNPSPELIDLIAYYENERLQLCRFSEKYFVPYRDEHGELVVNVFGDRENDL